MTSFASRPCTARCAFDAELKPYRATIRQLFAPVAKGASADHAAMLKGVFHITQIALRKMRNTMDSPCWPSLFRNPALAFLKEHLAILLDVNDHD
jgi:hypothetical protein